MRRVITRLKFRERMGQEARTLLKLSPWVICSLVLAAFLWTTDLAATAGLFQSPAPKDTPTLVPTDLPTLPPTVEAATPVLTATPVPEFTEIPTEVPTIPALATDTPPPTATPIQATDTPTPAPGMQTTASPTVTPAPSATLASDGDRYAEGDSNLRFEWGMLFDSVALGLSYVWLCCGSLVLLGIPTLFLVLWVASRRRRQGEE
jgi:hypothetical protein